MTTFHERLRRLKSRSRATAPEIALACGVSKQSVQAWLKDTMPKTMHLESIASYFGVTPKWLLSGDESQDKENIIAEMLKIAPDLSVKQLTLILEMLRELHKSPTLP